MEKKLKKYTSIPPHLYVNRSADDQLKRIVDEMQRPGYVLVARQMGKTNLLFNAKRTLENENRLFVYVDLSNVFKHERECYRNIIDTIIEPNEILFKQIENDIENLRKKKLPPHKEYSNSLRIILDVFQGDIVIVLDEIDALRSAEYSDNIFAQIRSNYFSRTNFPVFERLTYILSGVIEPTELIKDRNKSPFNIGDKIYLEDFTLEEHKSFIKKSCLKVPKEVADGIYSWTNGNPRLTFDICSTIENLILENKEVNIDTLNTLIKEKYLTTYDIAPIDHIRELVKTEKKVRRAVLNIQRNKSQLLSDEIKKKLYLFGIINSKFDNTIEIKNPIIKKSLSEDWIISVDKETQDNFNYGLEKIEQSEFSEAISALTEFLTNSSPTKEQIEICNYNLGFAFYNQSDLDTAIKYFSNEYSLELYKRNSKSLLGICKIGIGLKEEGIEILEEVVINESNNFAYRNAVFNLARVIADDDKTRALKLFGDLFDSTFKDEDETTEQELNKLRTLSHFFKAEITFEDRDIEKTIDSLREALKYSNLSDSLYLKLSLYNLTDKKNANLKTEIIDSIIESEIKFDTKNNYSISFSEDHLYSYLDLSFNLEDLYQFEKLLNYSYSELFQKEVEKYKIVYLTSKISSQKIEILKYILDDESNVSKSTLTNVYRDLALNLSTKSDDFFKYFNKYLNLFLDTAKVTSDDIYIFAVAIKNYSDLKKIDDGIELCKKIDAKIKDVDDEEIKAESIIIYYWFANLNFSLKHHDNAIKYSNKTIQLIKNSKRTRTSMIDEKGLKSIIEQMNQIINSSITRTPIVVDKKYGRNEKVKVRYNNGRIVENKYKKLEADILAERCQIITSP